MGLFGGFVRIPVKMLTAAMQAESVGHPEDAVTRLSRGDADALFEVVPQYQHRLYRFLVRMVRQPAVADDLFQQTWVRVIEKIGRFDSRGSFDSWLFSIARNLAVDHLRRKRDWSLEGPEDRGLALGDRLTSSGPDPLGQVLESERASILGEAMDVLPSIHREVLTLRFEQGMKLEDIASVANIPLSTVKSRLHRALEGLKGQVLARLEGGRK